MKIKLVSLLFLSFLTSHGQDLSLFNHNYRLDWIGGGYETLDEKTLESIFPKISGRPYLEIDQAKENLKDFHLIDLNRDGTDEIVYNGWSGGEGEAVLILKKSYGQYKLIQSFLGRIVKLNMGDGGLNMVLLDYPCCADYVDHLTYLKLDKESASYTITEDFAIVATEIDDLKLIDPINFTVSKEAYNMRLSPKIETELDPNNYPFDLIQNQNISAIFNRGDKGVAIAEQVDETGRIWWLVVMYQHPKYPNTIFYRGQNDFENYKPIGWMSSKYLEKM